MRKLIYPISMTLDGQISRPDGALDWARMSPELHTFINAQQSAYGAYILGRRVYEMMEEFWPTADEDPDAPDYVVEYARIWREKPKIVASSTLQSVGPNARLAQGDIAEEIARLKREPGNDLEIGGPTLAASVVDQIDEFHVFINPVAIGQGVPLFPGMDKTLDLRLAETRTFDLGVVLLRYLRADA